MNKASLLIALGCAALLAGCAKTDEQVIVSSCLESDEALNQAYCDCTYAAMENSLPEEVITNIADALRDGAEDPVDAVSSLPPNQQMSVLGMTIQLLECAQELE